MWLTAQPSHLKPDLDCYTSIAVIIFKNGTTCKPELAYLLLRYATLHIRKPRENYLILSPTTLWCPVLQCWIKTYARTHKAIVYKYISYQIREPYVREKFHCLAIVLPEREYKPFKPSQRALTPTMILFDVDCSTTNIAEKDKAMNSGLFEKKVTSRKTTIFRVVTLNMIWCFKIGALRKQEKARWYEIVFSRCLVVPRSLYHLLPSSCSAFLRTRWFYKLRTGCFRNRSISTKLRR